MQSKATTVQQYLEGLPADRRAALETVRGVILKNLDSLYEEGMQYGMIGYYVPHSVYPAGYHCDPSQPLPFVCLASQKNHMAVYLTCLYGNAEHESWFRKAWAQTGRKLDMGKSCVRFKKIEDLALDVLGESIRRVPVRALIQHYKSAIKNASRQPAARKAPKSAKPKAATRTKIAPAPRRKRRTSPGRDRAT